MLLLGPYELKRLIFGSCLCITVYCPGHTQEFYQMFKKKATGRLPGASYPAPGRNPFLLLATEGTESTEVSIPACPLNIILDYRASTV